ncbi:MAG TPA: POTRA domain-containing protein [Bryobacteraceae bacterium]|jgi:outer membrane protein assembly factor BamA|nr:POTRA domain-containing protein [Bryobacteraceae bacterium]
MVSLLRSALLLYSLALLAAAQVPQAKSTEAAPPGIIRSIIVQGNKIYKPADIKKVLGLKAEEPATPAAFRAAQSRLLATDLFSNVEYQFRWTGSNPAQYEVTYKVTEFDELFPLQFEDLGVSDDALRQYLRAHMLLYNDRIPATSAVVNKYAEVAQEFIAKTKPSLKIKGFVSSEDPNHPAVIIRPDTPFPRIARVTVTGNKAIDTPTLEHALNDVAIGQRLSDTRIREILNGAAKTLYAAKGYVAVTFPKIQSEKSTENAGYVVHVEIQEGPVFHFGTSTFRGGTVSADDIRSMMHFRKGEVFDGSKAEQLRRDLVDFMRHRGHLSAAIQLSHQENDKNLTVNLIYAMQPGPVYKFETLNVHGLDIQSEPAIRKLWAEKPGEAFNPDYPDFFLKRIKEMGIMDNLGTTKSTFVPDTTAHNVTVNLFFRGAAGEAEKKKDNLGGMPPVEKPEQEPPF